MLGGHAKSRFVRCDCTSTSRPIALTLWQIAAFVSRRQLILTIRLRLFRMSRAFLPVEHEDAYFAQFEADGQRMLEEAVEKHLGTAGLPLALKDLALRHSRITGSNVVNLVKTLMPRVVNQMKPTFGRQFQQRFGERFGVLSLLELK